MLSDVSREFVFVDSPQFASCHASTLVVLDDQSVYCAWFGGSAEGRPDVAIWASRRLDGIWNAPRKIADAPDLPHWNPVLYEEGGVLYLFYKVGRQIPLWETWITRSNDHGQTWESPMPLVTEDRGGRGPVKNKLIRLTDGRWVAPASLEGEAWNAFVDISCDRGATWTKSGLIPHRCAGKGIIQPTLWAASPAQIHMLVRSTEGEILRSDSTDGGHTWCEAYGAGLPNNNSGIDLAQTADGKLVLVYNPVSENWGARTPLVAAASDDDGATWYNVAQLETEEGEYSYPAIVITGHTAHISYTWRRQRIAYSSIHLESRRA